MVLVLLIILWAVVLVPPWLKNRSRGGAIRSPRSDGHSIAAHRAQLSKLDGALHFASGHNVVPFRRPDAGAGTTAALARPEPVQRSFAGLVEVDPLDTSRQVMDFGTPMTKAAARKRRQQVLLALFAVTVGSLLAALAYSGPFVLVNLLADAALVSYVILLVRHNQVQREQANKVRPIRPPTTEQAPIRLQSAPNYLVQSR